jgi:hypothetical protein
MRMDIKNSPGARARRDLPLPRDNWRHAGRCKTGIGDGIYRKCLCCINHRVTVGAERIRRICKERTKGVLWCHASVNLVKPRAFALAAARVPADAGIDRS